MLVTNKQTRSDLEKRDIYQIKCDDCENIYIGQPGRKLSNQRTRKIGDR